MSIFLKFKFLGRGEVSYDKPEKREVMSILLTFIRTNQSTHSRVSCGQWFSLLLTWFIAMSSTNQNSIANASLVQNIWACGANLSENQHILDEIERLKTKFYTVLPTCKSNQCGVLRQTTGS